MKTFRVPKSMSFYAARARARLAIIPARRWLAWAVAVPFALSVGVHVVLALVVRFYSWTDAAPSALTDVPTDTVLTLNLPPAPPLTREPPVVPKPQPAPPAPEPPPPTPQPKVDSSPTEAPSPDPVPAPEPARPDEWRTQPAREPEVKTVVAAPAPAEPMGPPRPIEPPPPSVESKTSFAGVKADRAERVVYVVDASGAMTTSLTFVLDELARSIGALDREQYFQVILFREPPASSRTALNAGGYEIFTPRGSRSAGLIRADDSNKDAVRAWLRGIRPLGRSAPLPGLRAALTLKPQLVFLLTRSITRSGATPQWDAGNEKVLDTLNELNPRDRITGRRAVTLKTIQFIDDDPSGLLQGIAAEHGDGTGSYTLKSINDLNHGH